ncbi:MAG TPA: transposase [Patescibacteria group bacterium]|nr:transposase [Patescibacteria group bacterium]
MTVCTRNRKELFYPRLSKRYDNLMPTDVAAGLVPAETKAITGVANTTIVENILHNEIPRRYGVEIDFYIFMPDHIHLIIALSGDHKGRSYTLGQIIGAFKSLATRAFWNLGYKGKLFQPNF